MTVGDVAKLQSVRPEAVRGWILKGTLPAQKVQAPISGRSEYRIHRDDYDAFVQGLAICCPGVAPQHERQRKSPSEDGA